MEFRYKIRNDYIYSECKEDIFLVRSQIKPTALSAMKILASEFRIIPLKKQELFLESGPEMLFAKRTIG